MEVEACRQDTQGESRGGAEEEEEEGEVVVVQGTTRYLIGPASTLRRILLRAASNL